jgi:hypothetical protein
VQEDCLHLSQHPRRNPGSNSIRRNRIGLQQALREREPKAKLECMKPSQEQKGNNNLPAAGAVGVGTKSLEKRRTELQMESLQPSPPKKVVTPRSGTGHNHPALGAVSLSRSPSEVGAIEEVAPEPTLPVIIRRRSYTCTQVYTKELTANQPATGAMGLVACSRR